MPAAKESTLKRPVYEMPEFIASALRKHSLVDAYDARPPYQRNDYIGWITRAKLDATRTKRLKQMLSELKGGKLYMNMQYRPKQSKD
ncbi:YdeI/OmpD-associated family protein [Leptospira sp. 96542]|nr:YdeI/OmpD-associated family protein [Leptospira sp. 96542]